MAVPDTSTFTLQDVVNEISPSSNTLRTCFDESVLDYFNNSYVPYGFDPHNTNKTGYRLSNFRDYGSHNGGNAISVSPTFKSYDHNGGSFTLSIDTGLDGMPWSATCPDGWVSFSKTSGAGDDSITVTVGTNNSSSSRQTTITVSIDGYSYSATCDIDQAGDFGL